MSKFVVRYGSMKALGVMTAKDSDDFRRGNEVVVRSNRGIETGQVLCEATDDALSNLDQPPSGHILRMISDDDAAELAHIEKSRDEKISICQKHVDDLALDMQLVDVEQLLGGERIIVFYLAEDRVDFRDLVKLLASEFQTRIEMKQIGVRDEAKLLADYGDCGRPVCCNTFLSKMPPVSMKMAKLQKATLDPTKISGRCGRLKCCLRYEFDHYETVQKQLPRVGTRVLTREGTVRILNQEILTEQLLVETEDHRRMIIDAGEVISIVKGNAPTGDSQPSDSAARPKDRQSSDRQTNDRQSSERPPKDHPRKESPNRSTKSKEDQRKSKQSEPTAESENPGADEAGTGRSRVRRKPRKHRNRSRRRPDNRDAQDKKDGSDN